MYNINLVIRDQQSKNINNINTILVARGKQQGHKYVAVLLNITHTSIKVGGNRGSNPERHTHQRVGHTNIKATNSELGGWS